MDFAICRLSCDLTLAIEDYKIKTMIERQKERYAWEFIFLGANIDAVEVAERFGVDRTRAQNFHNDSEGIALNYCVLSETVAAYRNAAPGVSIDDDWNKKIETDYEIRSKQSKK